MAGSRENQAWINSVRAISPESIHVCGYFNDYLDFGEMQYTVNNQNGFSGVLGEAVGITVYERDKDLLDFKVYPNPVQDEINISIGNELTSGAALTITDVTGKSVYSGEIKQSESNMTIDLGHLNPGMYFMKLTSGNHEGVRKLLKK
jgi:hypothetical protein